VWNENAQSWLNLQVSFDLKTAEQRLRGVIDHEVEPRDAA
jgi:plasmid maintenance system antidote protein VapI